MTQPPPTSPLLPDPMLRGAPVLHGYKVTDPAVLVRKLAEGGMATVYLGVHLRLRVPVAVKVLKSFPGDGAAFAAERFTIEAEQAARLAHQNIVRVYDFRSAAIGSKSGRSLPYLVMEYVDGETVEARVRRRRRLAGREAATIAMYTARGLRQAHRERVVHRDIKPANILLSRGGDVKLADLGIAKATGSQMPVMTQENTLLGTPQYMAPELWRGARHASAASDVYALGATIGFMLTGEHLLGGGDLPEIMHRAVLQGFPSLKSVVPAVDPQLVEVVRRATAQEPTQRPSAAELETALRQYLDATGGEENLEDANAGGPGGGPPTNLPTAAVITAICRTLDAGERQRSYVPTTIEAGELDSLTRSLTLPPAQPAPPPVPARMSAAAEAPPPVQAQAPARAPIPSPPTPRGPAAAQNRMAEVDWPPMAQPPIAQPPMAPPPANPALAARQPVAQQPPKAQPPRQQQQPPPAAAKQPRAQAQVPAQANFSNVNIGGNYGPPAGYPAAQPQPARSAADTRAAVAQRPAQAQRPAAQARVPQNPIRPATRKPPKTRRGLLFFMALLLFAGGALAAYHFNFADVVVNWLMGPPDPAGKPSTKPSTRPTTGPATRPEATGPKDPTPGPVTANVVAPVEPTVVVTTRPTTLPSPAVKGGPLQAELSERLLGRWVGPFQLTGVTTTLIFEPGGSLRRKSGLTAVVTVKEEVGTYEVLGVQGEDALVVETSFPAGRGDDKGGLHDVGDATGRWVISFQGPDKIVVKHRADEVPSTLTRKPL